MSMRIVKCLELLPVSVAFVAVLCSCSTQRNVVPLSEFCSAVDSISKANNVKMFVAPNRYKAFGLRREDFENEKRRLLKYKDTLTVYTLTMEPTGGLTVFFRPGRDTLENVIARYWKTEELRKHKKNRVAWREYKDAMYKINPDVLLVSKKEWKKTKMLRSEVHSDLMRAKPFKLATYAMEKDIDGRFRTTRRVTDSVELAEIKSRRCRWNSVANGMLGAAYTEEPFVGLVFGAEGYKLSDTETLWLKVYAGNCHPFPSSKPTCEVRDYDTYINVEKSDGSEETVYVKVRAPKFRLLHNPPFRYTFTANFEYDGRWYYVFMCDDPLRSVCKPINVPNKDYPLL